MDLHPDLKDLFSALAAAGAEYLVVDGYAVAYHGRPRFTKDLDLWIGEEPGNLARVLAALPHFRTPGQRTSSGGSVTRPGRDHSHDPGSGTCDRLGASPQCHVGRSARAGAG